MLSLKRKDRVGIFLATLKKYFPAVTLRPIHEVLQLYGILLEENSISGEIIKGCKLTGYLAIKQKVRYKGRVDEQWR